MTIRSDRSYAAAMQAEINVTPLIDVMLALVVVFMIATPLLMKRLVLPLAGSSAQAEPIVEPAHLGIAANGALTWNGLALPPALLREQLRVLARSEPQPELRIEVERAAAYQTFASVLADAKAANVARISVEGAAGD